MIWTRGDKRKYLTESTNRVIMESMKRVDVLKGIEQILVQKAYETGHISHRADGDWQKTNNGWVRVKGSPAPDTDDSAERAEYERQLTEEQNQRAEDDPTGYGYEEPPSSGEMTEKQNPTETKNKAYDLLKQLIKNGVDAITESESADLAQQIGLDTDKAKDFFMKCGIWVGDYAPDGGWEEWDNDHILGMFNGSPDEEEEIFGETPEFDSNEDREFDSLQKSITKMYDTGTLKDDISQIPADSSGSDPDEKEVREFVNGLLQMHDMSRSRLTTDHLDSLEEQIADLWHKGQVGKSAVRDMRSAPATKNMGF